MSRASENDFRRAERKLTTLSGSEPRDLLARCHCKLATWAQDHGWVDISQHHFKEARLLAENDVRQALDGIAHWFGDDRTVYLNPTPSDMTTLPWISDLVDAASRSFVERHLRDSVKSPWTRSWTLGGTAVEGHDIQSAEMQASWAGALWMLPEINRQHAALILAKSNEPSDVARGIALGQGKRTRRHSARIHQGSGPNRECHRGTPH